MLILPSFSMKNGIFAGRVGVQSPRVGFENLTVRVQNFFDFKHCNQYVYEITKTCALVLILRNRWQNLTQEGSCKQNLVEVMGEECDTSSQMNPNCTTIITIKLLLTKYSRSN